jgi:hypothetical protein
LLGASSAASREAHSSNATAGMAPNTLPGLQDKDGNAAESGVINSNPSHCPIVDQLRDSA